MIEELKKELISATQSNNQKSITMIRGRLISAYKKEIEKAESSQDNIDNKEEIITGLKTELEKQLNDHKIQLDARYSNEVINGETALSKIIEIPKHIGIAAEKVKTCITDLKLAQTTKQKVFKTFDLIKSAGMVLATPAIYVGKLALKHWYVPFAALSVLKITDIDWINDFAKNTNLPDNILTDLENIRNAPIIKPIYDTFDILTDKAIGAFRSSVGEKLGFDYNTVLPDVEILTGISK